MVFSLSWKERLYALLLRRVLGPWLTLSSQAELHESLNVSIAQGEYILTNLDLNVEHVALKLLPPDARVEIVSASVGKVRVQIRLLNNNEDDDNDDPSREEEPNTSLAWRAFKLAAVETTRGSVSLVVHVELEDVSVILEPSRRRPSSSSSSHTATGNPENATSFTTPTEASTTTSTAAATPSQPSVTSTVSGLITSYLEAALASLRLSVSCQLIRLRLQTSNPHDGTGLSSWIEVRAQLASYQDANRSNSTESTITSTADAETTYNTILHKTLDVTRITITTSATGTTNPAVVVALLEGTSRCSLRVIQYDNAVVTRTDEDKDRNGTVPPLQQQDIQVMLNQKLNVSIDTDALNQIRTILYSFQRPLQNSDDLNSSLHNDTKIPIAATATNPYWIDSEPVNDNENDQVDYQTITGLLKQYQEARKLVERNEVRGGILVPSFHAEDGVTFDTFFDANEQSFGRYSVLESIMLPNARKSNSVDESSNLDWIHTKLMLHLQEGGIKLSFPSAANTSSSDEYVLLTFNDVNLSSQLSLQFTEHTFTIGQMELEDAFTSKVLPFSDGIEKRSEAVLTSSSEISTLLRFSSEENDDDEDTDYLVSAPSLSLSIKTGNDTEKQSVSMELMLEPLEISYRSAVIAKLTSMLRRNDPPREKMSMQRRVDEHTELNVGNTPQSLHIAISCSSVAIEVPCPVERDLLKLYRRCGYICVGTSSQKSALGLAFDRVEMDWYLYDYGEIQTDISIQCHNIVAYASSPKNTSNVFDLKTERFDILAVSGRTEIDPCIPISVKYTELCPNRAQTIESNNLVLSSSTFPKVPCLSSFKTRQDEDDDIQDTRLGGTTSKKAESQRELRKRDQQESMLSEIATSNVVVSIHIPEVIGDITSCEWQLLTAMVDSLHSNSDFTAETTQLQVVANQSPPVKRVSVTLHCEFVSLAVHDDVHGYVAELTSNMERTRRFSFLMKMEDFKYHTLLDGFKTRHIRVLANEIDLFEVLDLNDSTNIRGGGSMDTRVTMLRQRGTCHSESTATPILHRSHLFAPISRDSPCVLLDIVVTSGNVDETTKTLVHFTLYDTTYRYSNDSRWYEFIASLKPKAEESTTRRNTVHNTPSLTQAFISIADCNADYSSSTRFPTASRTILRIGDFRLSSNVVLPAAVVQAYTVSLGDVAVYLCNTRFPYNFENRRLIGARSTLKPDQLTLAVINLPDDVDDILRRMNYKTIFTLDSCDTIVSMSNAPIDNETGPPVSATFTVGQLYMFACKDSLSHLSKTVGELSAELTAMTETALEELKAKSTASRKRQNTESLGLNRDIPVGSEVGIAFPRNSWKDKRNPDFLIDGYDWMTVDSDDCGKLGLCDGEDHAARWYGHGDDSSISCSPSTTDGSRTNNSCLRIISHHFPLQPASDPIGDGDMGITKFVDSNVKPKVRLRLIVCDLAFKIRFFDGYDWPAEIDEVERNAARCESFVIPIVVTKALESQVPEQNSNPSLINSQLDRKSKLMGDLLAGADGYDGPFQNIPLPEEKKKSLKEQAEMRRLSRRTSKCFQISGSGISIRLDSLEESDEHRLVSCLNLRVQDLFISETISSTRPVKLLGEWFNEQEHPRDSNDGLFMLKMVTWHPLHRMSDDGKVASDESEVALKILPMRCLIDQRAIAFARAFFNDNSDNKLVSDGLPTHLHAVPPPLFTSFRVQSFKLKVDYRPQKLDTTALRNGSVIELINLSPLDGMILTLKEVKVANEVGFGAVVSIFLQRWVQDICATQLLKFVANSRPLEPITELSGAAVDMVILPWEAFRNGESIQKAIRSGAKSFSKTVVYEMFNISSRAAEYFAGNASRVSASSQLGDAGGELLPSRPLAVPKHVLDTGPHAMESIYRGLQAANYKIVIIPYREYHRTGATSAARCVIKGIPVAITAPASGAAEALSFALLGARNQIRPDIRKEEEASMKGLYLE